MRRNELPLKRKTSVAQKNTSRLIYKLVSYMLHIRRFTAKHNYSPANIIAMDEKPVGWIWSQTLQWIRQVLVQSQ